MDKWEDDIRRYHAGEMTPQEQHALEKKALSDPFLYEALEGADSITERDFTNDLKEIELKINSRTTERENNFGLAGAASKSAYVETTLSENPKLKIKNKWMWPLRIAASLALLAAVYFSITPLIEKNNKQLTQQKPAKVEKNQAEENKISDSTAQGTDQLALTHESKSEPDNKKESRSSKANDSQENKKDEQESKPAVANALSQKNDSDIEIEKIATREVADLISESPSVAVEEKRAESKKESSQASRSKAASGFISNQKIIKGKVFSADDGIPLPGVNIVIKGTTTGTVTDMQGNYQITSESSNPTLVYSFIGLQTEEVTVANQSELNVNLQTDVSQLSEVVVTGYSPVKSDLDREPIVKLAEPEGGRRAYDKYLKNSLQYPQQALDNKIKGRVTIQFTVETDGSLSDFTIFRGLGYGCDEEVIRLIKDGPKWSPTTEDNVAVESEVRVRVKFALPN
ncbi:MAG: TonB family protein [Cyclobacteriaceae bacterium]|nr:TonB family protein [Cyclobacteriaceae bacterium]